MYRQRLKEYIEEDVIYQAYKEQKEFESSDFDNFCILHCEDIEEALFDLEQLRKENQELQTKINTYENPEDLTLMFMYCEEKAKDKIKEFTNKFNATIECLEKLQNWDYYDGLTCEEIAKPLKILKGCEVDE